MAESNLPPFTAEAASLRYLSELSSLNYRFIGLLCTSPAGSSRLGMPDALQASLALLPETDHRRLAGCPYSLFDIEFCDAGQWQTLLSTPAKSHCATDHARCQFTLAALLFAQRLAHGNRDLARLLLGMSRPVAAHLSATSIGQLMDRSADLAALLKVRLVNDPNFWPDLVNYVQEGTPQQYLAAQTLALQLMAAREAGISG